MKRLEAKAAALILASMNACDKSMQRTGHAGPLRSPASKSGC